MHTLRRVLRHVFIPGQHNNHQSAALSHAALSAYLVIAVVAFVVLRNIAIQTQNVLGFATDISPERVIELTNQQRSSNGIGTVSYDALLTQAAYAKAQDMFSKGYWSHFGPSGESPWTFILGAGYQYEYAGENLAKNFMDSGAVVQAWMNSPTHRDNILNTHYRDVGVAVVNGNISGEDTTLVVQMFGSKSVLAQTSTTAPDTRAKTLGEEATPIPVRARALPQTNEITPTRPLLPTIITQSSTNLVTSLPEGELKVRRGPYINLFPAFRFMSAFAVALLIVIFMIDLYHLSHTPYDRHRGKHIIHIVFLAAILIGIFFLGKGVIL